MGNVGHVGNVGTITEKLAQWARTKVPGLETCLSVLLVPEQEQELHATRSSFGGWGGYGVQLWVVPRAQAQIYGKWVAWDAKLLLNFDFRI